ncbi:putative proline-rich receptor-like protein kinase PERK3 [Iris pallida]|uniref:Proline-rich receptor-like protein kinase PERK3 n=1 Tax=Iris pallida TaxID=29817 RepID=A0AAX6GA42_IRIPA|nr:putative proline-rich receptor-like protein kinase PERK3 [Iris pallida]
MRSPLAPTKLPPAGARAPPWRSVRARVPRC